MRLLTTALTSALILALGVTACGDDEDEGSGGKGGRGGTGGTGGTGGAAGGGSGGKAGTGGSGGTGGGANAECVQRAKNSGTCDALAECSCTRCATELDTCYDNPNCLAIRQCAARTNCCSPAQGPSCTRTPCLTACETEIQAAVAAAADGGPNGLTLATGLSECVYTGTGACTECPVGNPEGGTEGGTEGGAGDASTD